MISGHFFQTLQRISRVRPSLQGTSCSTFRDPSLHKLFDREMQFQSGPKNEKVVMFLGTLVQKLSRMLANHSKHVRTQLDSVRLS